jgi:hypothetical protein
VVISAAQLKKKKEKAKIAIAPLNVKEIQPP